LKREAPFGDAVVTYENYSSNARPEAYQTVRLEVDTIRGRSLIRIGFTDQRFTAHGGMATGPHFMMQMGARRKIREVLPDDPVSPNAYDPVDLALGYVGGILAGADKLSRVAWLRSDLAIVEVLGIEAVPSQSTLSRFLSGLPPAPTNDSKGYTGGRRRDCPREHRGTRWTWIPGRCCMKTGIKKGWRSGIRARA